MTLAPTLGTPQVAVFENLGLELTDKNKLLRRDGIARQRDAMTLVVTKYGPAISAAIRCEMVTSSCSYETACARFFQECERATANMFYCELGEDSEEAEALGDELQ